MALIKCPKCGKDVSDTANSCVHCGERLNFKMEIKNRYTGSFGDGSINNYSSNNYVQNPFAYYTDRQLLEKQTHDISTIKGIMVFFTILFVIGMIASMIVLLGNY